MGHCSSRPRSHEGSHRCWIIAEELAMLGWTKAELSHRRTGDAGKVRMARRLRKETTVSQRWIAEQLAMGPVSNVTFCLSGRNKV